MFVLKPGAFSAPNFGQISFKQDIIATGAFNSLIQTQGSIGITPVFLSDAKADPAKNNFNDLLFTYRIGGT